jgi:hypothetical protein
MKPLVLGTLFAVLVTPALADPPPCGDRPVQQVPLGIHGSPLDRVYQMPVELGVNPGRRFCRAIVLRLNAPDYFGWDDYTVEWTDEAKGQFWVEVKGRRGCDVSNKGECPRAQPPWRQQGTDGTAE